MEVLLQQSKGANVDTKEDVALKDSMPKAKWEYEHSIWKPIFYFIRVAVVAWAIYEYRTWFAVLLGVTSFFSLFREILSDALSEVAGGKLAKVLQDYFVHEKLGKTIKWAVQDSDSNLDLDEISRSLDEISGKLGHKNSDMVGFEDLAIKLDEINATLEEIKSNTDERD